MLIKALSTALTGIGGHFLNRRWEKALLFHCLFIFYILFCWFALKTYFYSSFIQTNVSSEEIVKQIEMVACTTAIINLAGIIVLWLASLFVTVIDARKVYPANSFQWNKAGIIAAIVTTILTLLLLVINIYASVGPLKSRQAPAAVVAETNETISSFQSHDFYEHVYFGGLPRNSERLPAPPSGDGNLLGRIYYDDEPAEGISLSIVLNSKYRAKNITTDSNGTFKVALPFGDWKINSIQTQSWQHKPDSERFSMYHGGEDKLKGVSFNPHSRFDSDGHSVTIDKHRDRIYLNLTIKNDINLVWPTQDQKGVKASISDSIRWEPYPKAAKYYVQIKKLTRQGTTTYLDQITSRVVAGETSIPLSSLKHIKKSSIENFEYAADIYAFKDDGALIGKFSDTFMGGTFILSDGHVLIEEKIQDLFGAIEREDPEKMQKRMEAIALDRRRVDAVKVLIDENMVPEAQDLLQLVHSEYAKGDKEVLQGYIYSLKGDCAKAKEMFDSATDSYSNVCIPNSYKSICGY